MATKVFDEGFRDVTVCGSGVLKCVGKFSYDPVFKNESGIKATFAICELADAYSKIKVTAEVKNTLDEYDNLKSKMFQGR